MHSPLLQDQIEQLLKIKTESKNLDYKETLNWESGDKDAKLGLVKDVLAMANTQDGGRIVFGVRDADFALVGLSEAEYALCDQTKFNDFLQKYTEPKHSVQVYKFVIDSKYVVVIDVPEFLDVPILCKTDAHSSKDSKGILLRCGQVYVRTDKATSQSITSADEMRELLGRAVVKASDSLLASIERLIKGKVPITQVVPREQYGKELADADTFITERIGKQLLAHGSWRLCVYPHEYNPDRIKDHETVAELIDKSEVNLRGWNLPHTDPDNAGNFLNGRQSYTVWGKYIEAYRAYTSGCFVWTRAFWEDVEEKRSKDGRLVLGFQTAIWSITEMLLFVKRYYEHFLNGGALHVEITLDGVQGRVLVTLMPAVSLSEHYISSEKTIPLVHDASIESVRASFKDIGNLLIRRLFTIFNWDTATEEMISDWQTKLLDRKL